MLKTKYFFKPTNNTEEMHALRVDNENKIYTNTYLDGSGEIDRNDKKAIARIEVNPTLHTPKRKQLGSAGEILTQSATKRRKLLNDFNLEGGTDTL